MITDYPDKDIIESLEYNVRTCVPQEQQKHAIIKVYVFLAFLSLNTKVIIFSFERRDLYGAILLSRCWNLLSIKNSI